MSKCDLCAANGLTQTVIDSFKTEKVKEICRDCNSDISNSCKKLEIIKSKLAKKIERRAKDVLFDNQKKIIWWSVFGMKSEFLSRLFGATK
jgi:hypothetical protein